MEIKKMHFQTLKFIFFYIFTGKSMESRTNFIFMKNLGFRKVNHDYQLNNWVNIV